MSEDFLKRLGWFAFFFLIHVLILGRIHLFHYATPLLYVYFVAKFPRNHAKWAILVWSFALGLLIDIFSNTPGVAAASLTAIAVVQPYYFELFVPRDSADNVVPSLTTIGPLKFTHYIVPLVLLYCVLFYTFEMFTFFNGLYWLMCVLGSSVITLVLIFTLEIGRRK